MNSYLSKGENRNLGPKASDPRDRIFGILGLASESDELKIYIRLLQALCNSIHKSSNGIDHARRFSSAITFVFTKIIDQSTVVGA